jgi:hypothetical protein
MDGGAPEPIGTRDAVIEVAYSVGALVRAVQMLAAGLDRISEAVKGGHGDQAATLAAAEAALADAKRTADTSIASVVKVLEAMGETRP